MTDHLIELKNVRMAYGDKLVLDNLSLAFPERGMFALLGPSGRGKTTLLRLIAGLETPQSGAVSVPEGLRIAFCFQEDRLLPFKTVLENVVLATSFSEPKVSKGTVTERVRWTQSARCSVGNRKERLRDYASFPDRPESPLAGRWGRAPSPEQIQTSKYWIEKVGLAGEEDSYPASLSGGMKRRAALARALAFDAPVLLLDEPFRALDDATHAEMLSLVREAAKDKLLILVTHDEEDACGMQTIRL